MSLGGLVLAIGYPSSAKAEEAKKYGADDMPDGGSTTRSHSSRSTRMAP